MKWKQAIKWKNESKEIEFHERPRQNICIESEKKAKEKPRMNKSYWKILCDYETFCSPPCDPLDMHSDIVTPWMGHGNVNVWRTPLLFCARLCACVSVCLFNCVDGIWNVCVLRIILSFFGKELFDSISGVFFSLTVFISKSSGIELSNLIKYRIIWRYDYEPNECNSMDKLYIETRQQREHDVYMYNMTKRHWKLIYKHKFSSHKVHKTMCAK